MTEPKRECAPLDLEKIERQLRENARKHKGWSRKRLKELKDRKTTALRANFTIGPRGRCGCCGMLLGQGETVCRMCRIY